ncbi:hypothetical protein [Candidatus Pantoea bituminis]|nr:hypothetical protein [Pantoea bituminis]
MRRNDKENIDAKRRQMMKYSMLALGVLRSAACWEANLQWRQMMKY